MGTGLEKLLEVFEFLSPRQRVLVCQGAGVAVAGVYPFVFTDRGYNGQLDWLADTAAYKAPIADQAYVKLLAIAKEGTIMLPQHIIVELISGHHVHLGPKLTTPKPGPLAKRTTLSMKVTEQEAIIQHLKEKEVACDSTETEEDGEEDDEEEEGEEEVEMKEDEVSDEQNNTPLSKEDQEQRKHEEEQERKEIEEDKRIKKAEEKKSREDSQRAFNKEDDLKARTITVTYNAKDVSLADLKRHFQPYGKVLDVFLSAPVNNFATITFQSGALAQWLLGMERHTLQRSKKQGGPVAMQLQGWAGRLPGGSGRGNARRRSPVQQQNGTNPLRFFVDAGNLLTLTNDIQEPTHPHSCSALCPHPVEPCTVPSILCCHSACHAHQLLPDSRGACLCLAVQVQLTNDINSYKPEFLGTLMQHPTESCPRSSTSAMMLQLPALRTLACLRSSRWDISHVNLCQ